MLFPPGAGSCRSAPAGSIATSVPRRAARKRAPIRRPAGGDPAICKDPLLPPALDVAVVAKAVLHRGDRLLHLALELLEVGLFHLHLARRRELHVGGRF